MIQKWIKRGSITIAIIIFLVAGIVLLLHTPVGKSFVRQKVESYLSKKWQTEVSIGNVDYRLPNWIALEKVLVIDRQQDTLLSGGRIYAGIRIWGLFSNSIEITGVELESITLQCRRDAGDSVFNFQFILDAFAPAKSEDLIPSPGTPMRLSVKQLFLDNVRFVFHDKKVKLFVTSFIDHFSCFPNELNLEKTAYRFYEIMMMNSYISIIDSSSTGNSIPKTDATGNEKAKAETRNRGDPAPLLLALHKLGLQKIHFSYKKPFEKMDMDIQLDSLQLDQASLDLGLQQVSAGNIRLSNTAAKLFTWIAANNPTKEEKTAPSPEDGGNWKLYVDTITLHNNSLVYHNAALPPTKGIDYQHLDVQALSLEAKQSALDATGFFTDLHLSSLSLNKQLNVKGIKAEVHLTDSLLNIKDLAVAVNRSHLTTRGDIVLPLTPRNNWRATPPKLLIENSAINYGDLLLIQPNLNKLLPVSFSSSEMIGVSGKLTGNLQNFRADHLRLTTSSQQLLLQGKLDFRTGSGKVGPGIKADIQQLKLKKQLLSKDLQRQIEKANIVLPSELFLTGHLQKTGEKLTTALKMSSSFGQLQINGSADNISHPERLAYSFRLDARNLETGKWIRRDTLLGKVTGQINIKGTGIKLNKLAATTKLQLQSVVINGYPYSNINLEGSYAKSQFTARGRIDDPNLETDLDINGHVSNPAVKGTVRIGKADLKKLGLTPDSIAFAGRIMVDASYVDRQKLNATVWVDSTQLSVSGKEIYADSVSLICKGNTDSTFIELQSPFVQAELNSNYAITELSSELSGFLKTLYPVNSPIRKNETLTRTGNHRTSLNVVLIQSDLYSALVPGLEFLPSLTVTANYETGQKDSFLFLQVLAPGTRFNQLEVHELNIKAESIDSAIQFAVTGRDLLSGKKHLTQPSITGRLQKNLILVQARVADEKGKEFYSSNLEMKFGKDETAFRLLDDLTLNYNKWKVPPDNRVVVRKEGMVINNLSLEHKGQTIYINTKGQSISPITLRIDSFEIGNILALASQNDTPMASGTLKADISIQQPIQGFPRFTGVVQAKNLAVYNIPVGDLNIHSTTGEDSLVLNGGITGNNQIDFSGQVHAKNGGMNLETRLKKLDMSLVQGFTKDFLSQVSGQVTGSLKLESTADSLRCRGYIQLDSAAFAVKDLNTLYRINGQKISILYPDIIMDQFALTDTAGRQLTAQGRIKIISSNKYGLDIDVGTKNFTALQASRRPESIIYGTAILDAKLSIRGTSSEPIIEGSAFLHGKSSVHYVLSQTSNYSSASKGRLIFVDIDTLSVLGAEIQEQVKDTAVATGSFKGLKYKLNLEVSKDAEFSVIINPTTNDELVAKGEARLQAGVDNSGLMGITGVYKLQSGHYSLNNQILRRKFLLVKGSTVTFNGDPMRAVADITTEYEVLTSPAGLIETTNTDKDDAIYNKRLPFVVVFTIKGPISKPELAFDIKLKEGATGIENSLKSSVDIELAQLRNNVSDMNKQVFSLLVTSRFSKSGDNSLTGSDFNADDAVKDGVSQFLTEAMNQVADDLVKNVDIDMSLKSYETGNNSSSKTDLGVSMSKDLFKDRLTVTLGSSFTVSEKGDATTAQKDAAHYVPDITTTYKLSKDGRYKVKTYLKNEYDAVVEGYFSETGVSFTIELEYNKLKELVNLGNKANKEKP
jgi:translocation and assembly module TamB